MGYSEAEVEAMIERAVAPLLARIAELEARLALNSRNSSKPPSSDGLNKPSAKDKKKPRNTKSLRKPSGKSSGGQKGHTGHRLEPTDNPDHFQTHLPPTTCDACRGTLPKPTLAQTRQVFDLPPTQIEVTEHQVFEARCTCGKVHRGAFPDHVTQPTQYGPGLLGLAVHLTHHHMMPVKRTCDLLHDLYGVSVSEGTVLPACGRAAQGFEPVLDQIREGLLASEHLHADETGMRASGKLHWVHVAATRLLTLLQAHPKRGVEAMNEIGLLPRYKGLCVHDCLPSYFGFGFEDAVCNAHIGRELVCCHEVHGQRWAKQRKNLLWTALAEVKRTGQPLTPDRFKRYQARHDQLLEIGKAQNPDPPPTGKRGRIKRTKAGNLLIRLAKHREAVWRFATVEGVPFTNNIAEQAVRMPKVKQKVAGCFRTREGLDRFCTIRSCLSTMTKQGINPLQAITDTLRGETITLAMG